MQQKKDNTGFNIRKVYKKHFSISKNPEQIAYYSPELEFQKSHQPLTYTNTKRQKQHILDQTVNEAILNSKTYMDLKKAYQENKKKNNERLQQLNGEVIQLKNQKNDLLQEKDKIRAEKKKILEAIQQMNQKIQKIKEQNQSKRQNAQHIFQSEAEYFNNLLLSMRFQAQYEHNIDPDQMTYEQLLELEEKIGSVSKGLPQQVINLLPQVQVEQKHIQNQQKCTVCYCNYQLKEMITQLNPCKHDFHFQCLKTWLLKQKVCPLCKQQIDIKINLKQNDKVKYEDTNNNQEGEYENQQIPVQV